MNNVSLNKLQCQKVGRVLNQLQIRSSFYERDFLNQDCPEIIKLNAYFFAVAICHQTHKLHHIESNIWGWDVIEKAYVDMMRSKSPLLDPLYIQQIPQKQLEKELLIAFSEDHQCQHSTLDRIGERAGLLKDASNILLSKYSGDIRELISHQIRLKGKDGLYEVLKDFEAFSDPMRKKSSFLIKLLADANLITIIDPENYIAIMDYHMQRVLMRLGCVEINSAELKQNLINKQPVTDEPEIRKLCIDAMQIISEESKHQLWKMNDFFWTHGRSCCIDTTLCEQGYCAKSPCSFNSVVELSEHKKCVFNDICPGSKDESYRKLWQPIVETHFY